MSLRDLLFQHFWLKLFSLLMATLIWLAVQGNREGGTGWGHPFRAESVRIFESMPIMVMTDMGDRRSFSMEPSRAVVRLVGPASLLEQIRPEEVHLFVRVSRGESLEGPHAVEMQPIHGVVDVQIKPSTVRLGSSGAP